jgi:hypothetical protein
MAEKKAWTDLFEGLGRLSLFGPREGARLVERHLQEIEGRVAAATCVPEIKNRSEKAFLPGGASPVLKTPVQVKRAPSGDEWLGMRSDIVPKPSRPKFDLAAQVATLGADSLLPPERVPKIKPRSEKTATNKGTRGRPKSTLTKAERQKLYRNRKTQEAD